MKTEEKIKRYKTPQECAEAIRGLLKVKQQWLDYAKKREQELAMV